MGAVADASRPRCGAPASPTRAASSSRRPPDEHGSTVIDYYVYTANEHLALTKAATAYVSLHRTEGLGMTMAEAMLLGPARRSPRGYSGNLDFMTDGQQPSSSGYDMRHPWRRRYRPYRGRPEWAEPPRSCRRAAAEVYDDRAFARDLGERGRADLEKRLSVSRLAKGALREPGRTGRQTAPK